MDKASIENSFTYHAPTADQISKYHYLRGIAKSLAHDIYDNCPPSAETTLAIRSLEECIMWANKSIAVNS